MKKLRFVLITLIVLSVLVAVGFSFIGIEEPSKKNSYQPNILFILTDDQRWDTICLPNKTSEICNLLNENPMPFLQENIVEKGIVYTNAFVTNPACCPARASILSGGFYSHNIGVLSNNLPNGGALSFGSYEGEKIDQTTIATILQENGYHTVLIGKYLNEYDKLLVSESSAYIPPGWDDFFARVAQGEGWSFPHYVIGHNEEFEKIEKLEGYLPSIEKQKALDFIERNCNVNKCKKPFFLFLSSIIPHGPNVSNPDHPEDKEFVSDFIYRGRGWNTDAELFCNNNEILSLEDKPRYVSDKIFGTSDKIKITFCDDLGKKSIEKFSREQLTTLRTLDRDLSEIYKKLETMELLDQTVIIFASDNGFLWGEHGLWKKRFPYEESIRVPLIIRLPSEDHKIFDGMVSLNLDVPPTILDLAGIKHEIMNLSDGKSLKPSFNDTSIKFRDELLFQSFHKSAAFFPQWAMLRIFVDNGKGESELWKYVEYTTGEKELYNLSQDEYELNNLQNENSELVNYLSEKLAKVRGTIVDRENFPDPYSNFLPNAFVGESYKFQLIAQGGNGDYSWNFYNDNSKECSERKKIPSWVESDIFKKTGLISGVPELDGDHKKELNKFCIKVSDSSQSPHPEKSSPQSFVISLRLNVTKG